MFKHEYWISCTYEDLTQAFKTLACLSVAVLLGLQVLNIGMVPPPWLFMGDFGGVIRIFVMYILILLETMITLLYCIMKLV